MLSVLEPYLLNDSDGWLAGTNKRDLKVTSPSATKCDLAIGSVLSFVKLL